jgi:hypothetical protein
MRHTDLTIAVKILGSETTWQKIQCCYSPTPHLELFSVARKTLAKLAEFFEDHKFNKRSTHWPYGSQCTTTTISLSTFSKRQNKDFSEQKII